jgi:pimeloyl-ACP methyl ester carboxylesterase
VTDRSGILAIMTDEHGYSSADLPLYFEWHGEPYGSKPVLLLVHGGGSTIESNWGRLIPALEGERRMLAVELQGHGRTGSGDRPASFEGSADGVAALLEELAVGAVDVLGFSNGGQVAMQLAIRHPGVVRRLVVASAPVRRDGMVDGFWDGLEAATYTDLPEPYREADLAVSGDPGHAERMFHLDRELMLTGFTDWPDALVASIAAPTLVVAADQDVIRAEHMVRLASLIPDARLLIVPGNHGDYLGELAAAAGDPGPLQRTLPFVVDFLDQPETTTQA